MPWLALHRPQPIAQANQPNTTLEILNSVAEIRPVVEVIFVGRENTITDQNNELKFFPRDFLVSEIPYCFLRQ
jgi:hypothetical protein